MEFKNSSGGGLHHLPHGGKPNGETLAAFDNDLLRARIFYEKYALQNEQNETPEKTPEEMWRRIARGLASVEKEERRKEWGKNFFWLLSDFRFVPGGMARVTWPAVWNEPVAEGANSSCELAFW